MTQDQLEVLDIYCADFRSSVNFMAKGEENVRVKRILERMSAQVAEAFEEIEIASSAANNTKELL